MLSLTPRAHAWWLRRCSDGSYCFAREIWPRDGGLVRRWEGTGLGEGGVRNNDIFFFFVPQRVSWPRPRPPGSLPNFSGVRRGDIPTMRDEPRALKITPRLTPSPETHRGGDGGLDVSDCCARAGGRGCRCDNGRWCLRRCRARNARAKARGLLVPLAKAHGVIFPGNGYDDVSTTHVLRRGVRGVGDLCAPFEPEVVVVQRKRRTGQGGLLTGCIFVVFLTVRG